MLCNYTVTLHVVYLEYPYIQSLFMYVMYLRMYVL